MRTAQLDLGVDEFPSSLTKWVKSDMRCPEHGKLLLRWQVKGNLTDSYYCTSCRTPRSLKDITTIQETKP